jgi:ABC-2 type transport system ATP-binding protein
VDALERRAVDGEALSPALYGRGSDLAVVPLDERDCPLVVHGVTKRWRNSMPPVLRGAELELRPGDLTWLGGANGAGKTTLLRIAAGLISPDRGSVSVYGLHAERDRRRYQKLVGFLPAGDRGLYTRLTVRHQLEFSAGVALIPRRERRQAIERALERFELHALADRRLDRMSMGQRQRVRLAVTFLHEPRVILLDEPRTSLDDAGVSLIRSALGEALGRGCVAIWCSPSDERWDGAFQAAYLLEGGRLQRV